MPARPALANPEPCSSTARAAALGGQSDDGTQAGGSAGDSVLMDSWNPFKTAIE